MVSLEFAPYRRVIASPDLSGRGNLIAGPVPKRKWECSVAFICLHVLERYQARTQDYAEVFLW